MSDNPWEPCEVGVSLKAPESSRYAKDDPWITFRGSVESVKAGLTQAFDMRDADELSLAEIVSQAEVQYRAVVTAGRRLGGTVIGDQPKDVLDEVAQARSHQPSSSPAAQSKPAEDPVLGAIERAESVDQLQIIWAENQDRFTEDAVMAAYKAKGKALSS